MRFFIAGGGCYGTYYARQLDRARKLKKISVTEIVVVDQKPDCALAASLKTLEGGRLVVCEWQDFGREVFSNRRQWQDAMWVPTPIGPHILYHWISRALADQFGLNVLPLKYPGVIPALPYAQLTPTGTLVLSHAPGLCPTNCVEPKLCPLTKSDRDWEMSDTIEQLAVSEKGMDAVSTFVCQHYSHGVGAIAFRQIYQGFDFLVEKVKAGASQLGVATVSSCHGILDGFELKAAAKLG